MTPGFAIATILVPLVAALAGLPFGRRNPAAAREWAVLGAIGTLVAAGAELYAVLTVGARVRVPFLGLVDTGVAELRLDLLADQLSAYVAVAVGVVALCVQVYSTAYLRGPGTPDAPTRYPAYAATVSLFTAAMMLVVHADDLVVLLRRLGGHGPVLVPARRPPQRARRRPPGRGQGLPRDPGRRPRRAARRRRPRRRRRDDLDQHDPRERPGPAARASPLGAALLLLAGAAGKSAQFPLHTWLPDAMEGPTPVSALIHAATMVAAGVFLVARLLPLFLASDGALVVAAVVASITMLGAALAALAQDDLKRLLAWSTVSQVAYMLAGVSVASAAAGPESAGAQAGVFHLLTHAAFKALLFLVAGCVTHVVGSTLLADMGGLRRTHAPLALLLGLGLAGLAGIPPLGGFWSKEAVLTAAEQRVVPRGRLAGPDGPRERAAHDPRHRCLRRPRVRARRDR